MPAPHKIVTNIRKFSKEGKFSVDQDKVIRDLAKMVSTGQSSITRITKYFETNLEEYKETFGNIKLYAVMIRIRQLKKEMNQ